LRDGRIEQDEAVGAKYPDEMQHFSHTHSRQLLFGKRAEVRAAPAERVAPTRS
jgi:hypothetical protein